MQRKRGELVPIGDAVSGLDDVQLVPRELACGVGSWGCDYEFDVHIVHRDVGVGLGGGCWFPVERPPLQ